MIFIGGMIPSALLLPTFNTNNYLFSLPGSWQVPALLLCALVNGPRAGIIASILYITIGLFFFPVFSNGGGISYIISPAFGFLVGFIPAAWISGQLAKQKGSSEIFSLTLSSIAGLILIQLCGILHIIIGSLASLWPQHILELLYSYSLIPFSAQLAISPAISLIALPLRRILLIKTK